MLHSCSDQVKDSFTGESDCAIGSSNNDTLNPLQVNTDAMFGYTDWMYDAKDNNVDGVDDGTNSLSLSLTGGTLAGGADGAGTGDLGGLWSIISNAFDLYDDIMIVFKSASAEIIDPNMYVAYLLTDGTTSGAYQSPFINTKNGNLVDISHVSIYYRGDGDDGTPPVPLPAAGFLLLGAMGGLGVAGWRRRRKAA